MEDSLNKFTVIFLLNQDLSKVWLVYKTKGPYLNCWNGIGGKLRIDENILDGAIREAKEETGADLTDRLKFLMTINFCTDIELNVFYAKVNEDEVKANEDERMQWFETKHIEREYVPLAGEGNIPFFLRYILDVCER